MLWRTRIPQNKSLWSALVPLRNLHRMPGRNFVNALNMGVELANVVSGSMIFRSTVGLLNLLYSTGTKGLTNYLHVRATYVFTCCPCQQMKQGRNHVIDPNTDRFSNYASKQLQDGGCFSRPFKWSTGWWLTHIFGLWHNAYCENVASDNHSWLLSC